MPIVFKKLLLKRYFRNAMVKFCEHKDTFKIANNKLANLLCKKDKRPLC